MFHLRTYNYCSIQTNTFSLVHFNEYLSYIRMRPFANDNCYSSGTPYMHSYTTWPVCKVCTFPCMYVVFVVCSSFPRCSLPGVSNCKLCTKCFCNYRKPLQEFVSLELSVCVKKCHVPQPLEDSIQSTNYVHIIISVHACRLLHCHLDSSPLHRWLYLSLMWMIIHQGSQKLVSQWRSQKQRQPSVP